MGRDISLHIKERAISGQRSCSWFLFAVMVIYNDLVKTIPGLASRLQ